MPNSLLFTWVKNVYNVRINGSKSSALLSTKTNLNAFNPQNLVNKYELFHQKLNRFTTNLFTPNFIKLPLFEYKFYPVSTAPIIKTNKERY